MKKNNNNNNFGIIYATIKLIVRVHRLFIFNIGIVRC